MKLHEVKPNIHFLSFIHYFPIILGIIYGTSMMYSLGTWRSMELMGWCQVVLALDSNAVKGFCRHGGLGTTNRQRIVSKASVCCIIPHSEV